MTNKVPSTTRRMVKFTPAGFREALVGQVLYEEPETGVLFVKEPQKGNVGPFYYEVQPHRVHYRWDE